MAAHLRARALVPLLVVFAPEVVAGICDATTSNADICSVHADNDYTIPSGAHAWANCCLQGSPEVLTSCDLVPGSDGQQAVDLYDDDTRAQCCFGRGAEGSESLPNALPTGRSAPYSTFDQYCADNVADVCGMSGTQLPEGIRLTLNCHFEHIDLGSDWCPAPYAFTERGWLTSTGALVPHQCSKAFEPLVTPSGVLATRFTVEFFGDSECTQSQSLGTSPQIAVASSYDSMIADFKPTQCSELASGVYQLGFCNTADPSAPTYHQYLYSDSTCTTQIDTIQHDATGAGCTDINGAGFDVTVPFYIKTQCLPQPETPGTTFFLGENCEGQSAGIYLPPGHCGEAPNAPGQTVKNYYTLDRDCVLSHYYTPDCSGDPSWSLPHDVSSFPEGLDNFATPQSKPGCIGWKEITGVDESGFPTPGPNVATSQSINCPSVSPGPPTTSTPSGLSGLHLTSNSAKIIFGPNGECMLELTPEGKIRSTCDIVHSGGTSVIV